MAEERITPVEQDTATREGSGAGALIDGDPASGGTGAGPAGETAEGDLATDVEAAELAALYEALAAERRKAGDYLAQLQRLKADFDNYRRRMMQEQARWQDQAVGQFLLQVLPVLDNLERAVASAEKADMEALRQGLDLTLRQFRDTLDRVGIQPVDADGQPFDPNLHEAMMRVEGGEAAEGTVLETLQKGYVFKGQVLRPALVKVAVRG